MSASHVIIGDGIAGSSAAETIREEDPDADITVITDEGEALYNRILIKEFAKGKLPEAPISIHEPEWYDERDIDLQLDTHVTTIDTEDNEVLTHEGTVYEYDKLLVATGGTPASLASFGIENADADGIDHFWTFQDARSIKENVEAADQGIIVGAGLLGIDLAAICGAQELEANYLMRGECWWRYALDEEGAEILHDAMRERGVTPVFDSGVDEFETDEDGQIRAAVDPNGERFEGDWAGVAIGLSFNTEFLQDTAVETNDDGVVTDEYMRTNVDDVYAAGDLTWFYDTILGEMGQNGSWGSAKEQGSIAGQNMVEDLKAGGETDEPEEFRWVSSYSITHFDFPFLSFGHPTEGDDEAARKYSDTEYRCLAFNDGKIVGGVLIGDLSQQSKFKKLMREEREVAQHKDLLLEEDVDMDKLEEATPKPE
ncbi:FAD-dependent oxidoreductase [Halosimplex litoreum]|uniref:FAD-dependent oxidoreductase n=1 Tax=Halosimplex litoreum TaxID=1198301 RepID=A0A7T3FYT1_9EURY|nr:FAD-dependent oxidoreductase [Halosimplex litoreum]QPV63146.1 FAD-dependent oxidoreductase [Halosimplex litoreum]